MYASSAQLSLCLPLTICSSPALLDALWRSLFLAFKVPSALRFIFRSPPGHPLRDFITLGENCGTLYWFVSCRQGLFCPLPLTNRCSLLRTLRAVCQARGNPGILPPCPALLESTPPHRLAPNWSSGPASAPTPPSHSGPMIVEGSASSSFRVILRMRSPSAAATPCGNFWQLVLSVAGGRSWGVAWRGGAVGC